MDRTGDYDAKSRINQTNKDRYCTISLICEILIFYLIEGENRTVVIKNGAE
jgi:hypothetical protein